MPPHLGGWVWSGDGTNVLLCMSSIEAAIRPNVANDPRFKWTEVDGEWVMPSAPAAFLEYLLEMPRPMTQVEWCERHDVTTRTAARWKQDERFRKIWEKRAHDLNMSPERVQSVVDNLYTIATSGTGAANVQAAKLFLEMMEQHLPKQKIIVEDDEIGKMTTAELLALAGEKL